MLSLIPRILLTVALTTGLPRLELQAATHRRSSSEGDETRKIEQQDIEARKREVVFLLHGIGKGRFDMLPLQKALQKQGFEVVNWQYPSTKHELGKLAEILDQSVRRYQGRQVHFVTHSMGGIVVRTWLSQFSTGKVGRFVMIAPPNQGAYLADLLGNLLPYKLILGPAGQQLRQGESGCCSTAGTPNCEFGIIAGGLGGKFGMNPIVPGDNDGTVSVESTKLEGAKDFVLLPYAHPVIQMMPRTAKNVISFLRTGEFAEKE